VSAYTNHAHRIPALAAADAHKVQAGPIPYTGRGEPSPMARASKDLRAAWAYGLMAGYITPLSDPDDIISTPVPEGDA
jgi:hypothetical protein